MTDVNRQEIYMSLGHLTVPGNKKLQKTNRVNQRIQEPTQ